MKCFAAYSILVLAAASLTYVVTRFVDLNDLIALSIAAACCVVTSASAVALVWAISTAIDCWQNR